MQTYGRLPLSDLGGLEALLSFYRDWLNHDTRDEYWTAVAPKESYAAMCTPALHIGGWYDLFIAGTIENFTGLRQGAATACAREGQRLLVGPWAHGNFSDTIGERSFGVHSAKNALDATALQLAFFDEHLRDLPGEGPRVRYFLMGANTWVEDEEWPPAGSRAELWFLHSRGEANSAAGDGVLSREPCAGDEPPDSYVYDPSDPVPTVGGATFLPGPLVSHNAGAKEQANVERRLDVLVYTSPPLDASSTSRVLSGHAVHRDLGAGDDFTAKLVDVHPDGKAYVVCDGILSLRGRGAIAGAGGPSHPWDNRSSLSWARRPCASARGTGCASTSRARTSALPRSPNSAVPATEARASDFRTARQRVFHEASRCLVPGTRRSPLTHLGRDGRPSNRLLNGRHHVTSDSSGPVLVTGGSGFAGSYIIRAARSRSARRQLRPGRLPRRVALRDRRGTRLGAARARFNRRLAQAHRGLPPA